LIFILIGLIAYSLEFDDYSSAQSPEFTIDGISYKIIDEESVSVIGCSNTIKELEIPDSFIYNGSQFSVRFIEENAFLNNDNLTFVMIPHSVVSINRDAFSHCENLTDIIIDYIWTPSYVGTLSIGDDAFNGCFDLEQIYLPPTLTHIGKSAFKSCGINSIVIPSSVFEIGSYAFSNCANLSEVIFEGSSVSADYGIFWDCFNINYISINSNIISSGAIFNVCSKEATVHISPSLLKIKTLFAYNYPAKYLDLEDGRTSIEEEAFFSWEHLTDVHLPFDLESIGNRAFSFCISLSTLNFTNNLKYIGEEAFIGCVNLLDIDLRSIESIGNCAFAGCEKLTHLTLNNNLNEIGNYIFDGCTSLREIVIPDNINKIPQGMFINCRSLEYISLPNSIKAIEDLSFSGCSKIELLNLPETLLSIGDDAFEGCTNLISISIPDSVNFIGSDAFKNCISLELIELPKNLNIIESGLFYNCHSLKNISIPKNVIEIKYSSFESCSSLKEVAIPSNVTRIWSGVFYNCSNLENIFVDLDNNKYLSVDGVLFSIEGGLIHYPNLKGDEYTLPEFTNYVYPQAFNNSELKKLTVISPNVNFEKNSFRLYDVNSLNICNVVAPNGFTINPAAYDNSVIINYELSDDLDNDSVFPDDKPDEGYKSNNMHFKISSEMIYVVCIVSSILIFILSEYYVRKL